jgi:hypothetical protein
MSILLSSFGGMCCLRVRVVLGEVGGHTDGAFPAALDATHGREPSAAWHLSELARIITVDIMLTSPAIICCAGAAPMTALPAKVCHRFTAAST